MSANLDSVGPAAACALKNELGLTRFVGSNPVFIAELKKIPLVAKCDAGALILGETGTGKEIFARAIHDLGPRCGNPFVAVNCGAIPTNLMENELFGHQRGAFTGASQTEPGVIHEADGGTLFLDEVGSLPLHAQVKLLRFLQDKEYRPLGSTKARRANIRIIAAANTPLESAVKASAFRGDLFYRLNIMAFSLPPLRSRRDDIPIFARHFLAKYSNDYGKPVAEILPDALCKLLHYEWPGNVRELEHTIERAVLFSEQGTIRGSDLALSDEQTAPAPQSFRDAKVRVIAQFEKDYIQGLLIAYNGNISRAAKAAQKNRRAFWELIRKHKIDVRPFRSTSTYSLGQS
jgi:two-component system, NtrC family, response regulator GlrR